MKPRLARFLKRLDLGKDWVFAQFVFALLALLRLLPARRGIEIADALARNVGPLVRSRHRLALDNLRQAFPERDEAWLERTARANWGQMGRLAAEYVYLDQIFDYDPDRAEEKGLVEVEGTEIFARLREHEGPVLFFTAHIGCFELLPICAATFGLEVTALFRPPNNRFIGQRVLGARRTSGGHLVPSKAGAVWALASTLQRGGSVGMLVDQKFARGLDGTFFGRPVKTNPLLPKLARQFNAEVYPTRSIRLPDGRYRLELEPRLELPRDAAGGIDVAASCQCLNDIVERWVRETPEQWMWFHRRWKI